MPEIIDPARIAKLPVWAQNYIEGLKEVIDRKDERIAVLKGDLDADQTRTSQTDYSDPTRRVSLPDRPIRFQLADDASGNFERYVEVQLQGEWLNVRAGYSGRSLFVVMPQASNDISVGFVEG